MFRQQKSSFVSHLIFLPIIALCGIISHRVSNISIYTQAQTLPTNILPIPAHHHDYEYTHKLQHCHCILDSKREIENPIQAQQTSHTTSNKVYSTLHTRVFLWSSNLFWRLSFHVWISADSLLCPNWASKIIYQGGTSKFTVKRLLQPYILVTSVAFLSCVWHVKFKVCLQFKWEWAEKLPSFAKLVYPFWKPINQHFWWGLLLLWSYTSSPGKFLGCMVVVEMPGM